MMFFNADGSSPVGMGEDGRPLSYPTVFYPNGPAPRKRRF